MDEINTIQQASAAAAQEITEVVTLRGGTPVVVGEMSTDSFIPLLGRFGNTIRAGIEAYLAYSNSNDVRTRANSAYEAPGGAKIEQKEQGRFNRQEVGGVTPEQTKALADAASRDFEVAETARDKWFEKALVEIQGLPALLKGICAAATDKDETFWGGRKLGDTLRVARVAIRINFTENQDVQDFFGDGLSWLPAAGLQAVTPTAAQGTEGTS